MDPCHHVQALSAQGSQLQAMAPRPTCLLALVLCLVHGILTRQGSLSQPSISAEPGSVISRGRNVTILCQANGGFELFRLEKCSPGNGPTFKDEKNTSSFQKEARFAFTLMNPGCYVCIYQKSSTWSPRSEKLNLTVADADVTQASIPTASAVASGLHSCRVIPQQNTPDQLCWSRGC